MMLFLMLIGAESLLTRTELHDVIDKDSNVTVVNFGYTQAQLTELQEELLLFGAHLPLSRGKQFRSEPVVATTVESVPRDEMDESGKLCPAATVHKEQAVEEDEEKPEEVAAKTDKSGRCKCPDGTICALEYTKEKIGRLTEELSLQGSAVQSKLDTLQQNTKLQIGCPARSADGTEWVTSRLFFSWRTANVVCLKLKPGETVLDYVDIYFEVGQKPGTPPMRGSTAHVGVASLFLILLAYL